MQGITGIREWEKDNEAGRAQACRSRRKRQGRAAAMVFSFFCLPVSLMALTGCGAGGRAGDGAGTDTRELPKVNQDYREIVDDMASVILLMDQDSLAYDEILAEVGLYVADPQGRGAEETRALVQASIADFEAAAREAAPYEMDEDFAGLLTEWGIDPEEYQMNADARESNLVRYITMLQTIDAFLEMDAWYENTEADSDFAYMYEYDLREQESTRGYEYYSANYWFADWEEEPAAYAKEQIIDKLQSFVTEESVWESSREAVEQKMLVYLERLEDQTEEMAAHIGQEQEELYRLEQELEEMREGGGE